MTRRALTDKFLASLSSGVANRTEVFDGLCPGLSIRVTRAGKKTWTYTYTNPATHKRARLTLGTYPATRLQVARERALGAREKVEQGEDPATTPEARPVKTVLHLIEDRIRLEVRGKLRTCDKIQRRYDRHVLPIVGAMPVTDFRIAHLNKIVDPIRERNCPEEARKVHSDMFALFNFALRRGEVEYMPIAKAKAPASASPRQRFLTVEEIARFWRSVPSVLANSERVPTILRLCLVTGQRVGEVAGIRRAEVDFVRRTWTLPRERVKNKHDHIVPLSDLAIELLNEALRETNSGYAFPHREENRPISVTVVDRAVRRAEMRFGIPHWTPHDLRRTVATHMLRKENNLNISRFDRALVLNHRSTTKATVTDEVYDCNEYLEEKREALEKWGAFLSRLVTQPGGESLRCLNRLPSFPQAFFEHGV